MYIRNKDVLILSILTFLTVVAWIIFDVYHAATTTTISPILQTLIEPLSPTIDVEVIDRLRTR